MLAVTNSHAPRECNPCTNACVLTLTLRFDVRSQEGARNFIAGSLRSCCSDLFDSDWRSKFKPTVPDVFEAVAELLNLVISLQA